MRSHFAAYLPAIRADWLVPGVIQMDILTRGKYWRVAQFNGNAVTSVISWEQANHATPTVWTAASYTFANGPSPPLPY